MSANSQAESQKIISVKKFKSEIIPIILEKMETLQVNIGYLHDTIKSAVGEREERDPFTYNPNNQYNLNYYKHGDLFYENLCFQFDVDFLTTLKQSPVIKNELHLSEEIVFFILMVDENNSEYFSRQFKSYGNKTVKKLFKLFEKFIECINVCYQEDKCTYIVNNTNYLGLIESMDNLIDFCKNSSKKDWISTNNIEMIHESYLNELSSNSGLDTTIIYRLHKLDDKNPITRFKIAIHTESYSFQSYIKLFIWSESLKQWNILLVPTFKQFHLNPTELTSMRKPDRKYVDNIIKYCIEFSQNFI